jgi:hypothetical protein
VPTWKPDLPSSVGRVEVDPKRTRCGLVGWNQPQVLAEPSALTRVMPEMPVTRPFASRSNFATNIA